MKIKAPTPAYSTHRCKPFCRISRFHPCTTTEVAAPDGRAAHGPSQRPICERRPPTCSQMAHERDGAYESAHWSCTARPGALPTSDSAAVWSEGTASGGALLKPRPRAEGVSWYGSARCSSPPQPQSPWPLGSIWWLALGGRSPRASQRQSQVASEQVSHLSPRIISRRLTLARAVCALGSRGACPWRRWAAADEQRERRAWQPRQQLRRGGHRTQIAEKLRAILAHGGELPVAIHWAKLVLGQEHLASISEGVPRLDDE